jgi:hypothetical protein
LDALPEGENMVIQVTPARQPDPPFGDGERTSPSREALRSTDRKGVYSGFSVTRLSLRFHHQSPISTGSHLPLQRALRPMRIEPMINA